MSDGSLIFDTKIDDSGAERGIAKLKVKLDKATNSIGKQANVVAKLETEIKRLGSAQAPTAQYAQLEQAFQKADARLQGLIDRQDKFLATGGKTSGTAWEKLQYDIEKTAEKVREYQAQMEVMRADGSAFTRDSAALSEVAAKLDTAKIKMDELRLKEQEAGAALIHATSPKHPEALANAVNKASSSFSTFQKRISGVLRSALIFTVITQLAAKFREYIGEAAIKNDEFRTALGKLKGALQNAFTPIFTAVIPALTSLANTLARVITYISQFIGLLSGGGSSSGGSARLQSSTMSMMSTVEGATKAIDNESMSMMALGDAAKDAEKSMASFDEINQLSFNDKGGSGGGAGAGGVPILTPDPVQMPSWLVDIANRLADALERIKKSAESIEKSKTFNMLVDFFKQLVKVSAISTLDGVARAFESLAGSFEAIAKFVAGDIKGGLVSWLKSVWDLLTSVLNPFRHVFLALEWLYLQIKKIIEETDFGEWWNNNVAPWFTKERWEKLWNDVTAVWGNAWNEISTWWKTATLYRWWSEDVVPWFDKAPWTALWDAVKGVFISSWQGISSWWKGSALVAWWNEDVAPWFTSKKWQELWEQVKTAFQTKWGEITGWWQSSAISQWWENDVKPWFTKEKWLGIMGGIKTAFSEAFTGAANAAIDVVNRLIAWINGALTFDIPPVEVAGKTLFSGAHLQLVNIPSIPRLAQGAVIPPNREFLAVLGDQKRGTNIEAPLDTLVAAFRQVTRESNDGGKGEAVMEVDGQTFGRLVYKYGNKESKRVGVRLVGG